MVQLGEELGEELGFAGESGEAVGVIGEAIRQHFDGHVAIELGVRGPIHGSHAAFAELGDDSVVSDPLLRAHFFNSAAQFMATRSGSC